MMQFHSRIAHSIHCGAGFPIKFRSKSSVFTDITRTEILPLFRPFTSRNSEITHVFARFLIWRGGWNPLQDAPRFTSRPDASSESAGDRPAE